MHLFHSWAASDTIGLIRVGSLQTEASVVVYYCTRCPKLKVKLVDGDPDIEDLT